MTGDGHLLDGTPDGTQLLGGSRRCSAGSCIITLLIGAAVQYRSIVDPIDREIVRLLQEDASLSARELGEAVGLTATPCWRRVQNLERAGVLRGRVALVDPAAVNLGVTVLVHIRTNDHSPAWLERFAAAIEDMPEIVEAYRTSGEIDYVLRVVATDIAAYDSFYKRLIERVDLYDVRSTFVMQEMKRTTALPLDYA
jgi:Lrp/AsnC family transcriptional regulator, cysteine-sensing transcriptional activator